MIGPLLAVAATRVAGWPVDALPGGRQAAQWIIGTALGLYFSPLVAQRVSGFVWLLVLGALFAIAVGYLCGYFALAALLSLTAAAGLLLTRRKVPNAFVFGALLITIPLTIAGVSTSAMPRVLLNGAQLLLGCALGSRFNRSFLARAPRFVAAVVVTVAVAMGVSVLFALTMARLTGIHPATLILATAPGGIAEMAVTAQILGLGVPMVTSFHVTRVILLLTYTGPLFAWLRRRRRRARTPRGPVA